LLLLVVLQLILQALSPEQASAASGPLQTMEGGNEAFQACIEQTIAAEVAYWEQ
jgi:hypothetical protein